MVDSEVVRNHDNFTTVSSYHLILLQGTPSH